MLERLAVRWAFNVAALFVAAWVLSGISYGNDWWSLLIAAIVFTLVNAFVKPILAILSIPFIIVTLGIFYFLINVLMLYITDWLVSDFQIDTFWWAVLGAIIARALEEPLRQLASNAGLEGSVVVNQVRSAAKGQGLNVDTGEVEDLVKAGIIDPTMVTRSALQNAASIGKNILTTEAIVAEMPEKDAAGGGGGMPDMSGMM